MPVHYVEQLLGAQGPPGYAPRAHCKKRMRDAKDMPCLAFASLAVIATYLVSVRGPSLANLTVPCK